MKRVTHFFKQNHRELIKFGVIGALNTSVDFLIFLLFTQVFAVHYSISQVISYSMATVHSFLWSKFWTFKGEKKIPTTHQFARFCVTNGISMLSTLFGLFVLVDLAHMKVVVSKSMIIVLGLTINYVGYKFWAFRQKP